MDILTLADKVAAGEYAADRFPVTSQHRVGAVTVEYTYTMHAAMQHVQVILSQSDASEWSGVITPACDDRTRTEVVTQHVGIGLRIGGEASLCFECGPDGGHYHPGEGETMDSVMAVAARLADIPEAHA